MTKAYTTWGSKVYHLSRTCCDGKANGFSANGLRCNIIEITVELAVERGLRECLKCSADKPVSARKPVQVRTPKVTDEVKELRAAIKSGLQSIERFTTLGMTERAEFAREQVAVMEAELAELLKARD